MSPREDVRLSVIVTTHRRDDCLRQALASLADQTRPLQEVVVVDDGGPGSAAEVVAAFGEPFRYHWQPNAGQQAARNRGLEMARGEWVCYLDDDDLWHPTRHEVLQQALDHPTVQAWFSDAWRFTAEGDLPRTLFEEFEAARPGYFPAWRSCDPILQPWPDFPIERLMPTGPFWPSMMAVRRAVVQAIGGWKTGLRGVISEDLEFCFRLCRHASIGVIRTPTVRYRCHPGNESASEYHVSLGRAQVWRHVLQEDDPDPRARRAIEAGLSELHRGLIWQAWQQRDHRQVIRSWESLPARERLGTPAWRYLLSRGAEWARGVGWVGR